MLAKLSKRANARFTPEEEKVLKKYGISRDNYSKNLRVGPHEVPLDQEIDSRNRASSYLASNRYNNGNKDQINYADRARKIPQRDDNQALQAGPYSARNADINAHGNRPFGYKNLQDAERASQNAKIYKPVSTMKNELRDRNYAQRQIDQADTNYIAATEKAKAEYDKAIERAEYYRNLDKGYQKHVDAHQANIDKLLRKNK